LLSRDITGIRKRKKERLRSVPGAPYKLEKKKKEKSRDLNTGTVHEYYFGGLKKSYRLQAEEGKLKPALVDPGLAKA